MAQKRLDDWAEDFGNLLAKLDDWEFLSEEGLHTMMFAVQCQLGMWLAEVQRGKPARDKKSRDSARKALRLDPLQDELGFDL